MTIVSFDQTFLGEAAPDFSTGGCPEDMKRFALPVSSSTGQLVADVIPDIRHFIANNPQVGGEPLIVGSAARYLMATALTAFSSTAFCA